MQSAILYSCGRKSYISMVEKSSYTRSTLVRFQIGLHSHSSTAEQLLYTEKVVGSSPAVNTMGVQLSRQSTGFLTLVRWCDSNHAHIIRPCSSTDRTIAFEAINHGAIPCMDTNARVVEQYTQQFQKLWLERDCGCKSHLWYNIICLYKLVWSEWWL